MEPKLELVTINGKEYQLDIQQAKKLNLLKEKDNKVRSWEEFKAKYPNNIGYVYIEELERTQTTSIPFYVGDQLTPHEAKALAAFSKLLKLRRDWIGEWEPDWTNEAQKKYIIECICLGIRTYVQWSYRRSLSFPTEQMAQEFLKTFRDLIEDAKILI